MSTQELAHESLSAASLALQSALRIHSPKPSDSTKCSYDLGYEGLRCKGLKHPWVWSWNLSPAGAKEGLKQDERMLRGPSTRGDHSATQRKAAQRGGREPSEPSHRTTRPVQTARRTERKSSRWPRLGRAGSGRGAADGRLGASVVERSPLVVAQPCDPPKNHLTVHSNGWISGCVSYIWRHMHARQARSQGRPLVV